MPKWKGKDVTIGEYRKLKRKEERMVGDKKKHHPFINKQVWWISKDVGKHLYSGKVIDDLGEGRLKIKARNHYRHEYSIVEMDEFDVKLEN